MSQFWPQVPDDSGWASLTLAASWVAYGSGYGSPRYRRKNGRVQVEGLIKSGTTTAGTVIATLPASFRPASQQIYPAHNGATARGLQVATNGQISLGTGITNAELSLAGITFFID